MRLFQFTLCFLPNALASLMAVAGDFEVKQEDEKFYLSTPSCEALRDEVAAIAIWTDSLGQKVSPIEVNCKQNPVRKIEISAIIPARFKQLAGKEALCYGPNCFNAALIGHGLHKMPRAVGVNEIGLTLEHFCRNLSENQESPNPGDIGVIREHYKKSFQEIHAFNFIGQTVATKNGEAITATLQIQDKDEMFKKYGVSPQCQEPNNSGRCKRFVTYFSCDKRLIADEEVAVFDDLEHALAESLYNKDKLGELSALQDLFELVQSKLPADRTQFIKAKIESIEYQFSRMEGDEENYLLDIVKTKKKDRYPAIKATLSRALRAKAAGKPLPIAFRLILQEIIKGEITEFDKELSDALPYLTPSLEKRLRKHLKLPLVETQEGEGEK